MIARGVGVLGRRRPRSVHRLALSPGCWGINEDRDWGHQIDAERLGQRSQQLDDALLIFAGEYEGAAIH